ncbi:hypothetical protein ACLQ20_02855 [Micromonospora sp. DT46]|uniref:hypothetical protein n=1 Tax=Micromonospora sp. DT46 TaxID=3393435 RepID=UPI003CEC6A43
MSLRSARDVVIRAGAVLPGEDEVLVRWTLANLRACEDWLVRRDLLAAGADVLGGLRARYDSRATAAGTEELIARHAATPRPTLEDPILAAVVDRFSRDLGHYRDSLRAGDTHRLTVVPVEGTLTPLYAVASGDLFVPRWQLAVAADECLFTRSELFVGTVHATSSWLFFQSLVLIGAPPVRTVAQHLQIRESN